MKSIVFNIYKKFGILTALVLLNACNSDDFLNEGPLDQYTSSSVFKSEADMVIASNFLYTFLPYLDQRYGESRLWLWTDDGWRRNGGREGADLNWLADDEFFDFYAYDQIRHCNEFINRVDDATFSTDDLAERLKAEARFLRAFLYERMVFVYGGVPLVTEPQALDFFPSREDRLTVFNFVIDEFDAVADILPESYSGGDEGRITKWAALAMKSRASLNAIGWHSSPATLYDDAQAACSEILMTSGLSLDDGIEGFRSLFTHHSDIGGSDQSNAVILARNYLDVVLSEPEIAYKCMPRGSYQGTGDAAGNNQAQFGATQNLVQSFQTINGLAPADDVNYDPAAYWVNMDPRLRGSLIMPGDELFSIDGGGIGTYIFSPHPKLQVYRNDRADRNTGIDTGYLIRKYSGLSIEDNMTLEYTNNGLAHADFKIIRLAEVILMMAEALAADDNAQALDYVNMVRNRSGMPSYNSIGDVPTNLMNGTTGNALIDAVLLERRYEFAGEAPFRMLDIWRHKLGSQVYGPVEGFPNDETLPGDLSGDNSTYANTTKVWDEKYYLLPIPQEAFDINPSLGTNNPGWGAQ